MKEAALLSASENGMLSHRRGSEDQENIWRAANVIYMQKVYKQDSWMSIFIPLIQRGLFLFPQHRLIADKELWGEKKCT